MVRAYDLCLALASDLRKVDVGVAVKTLNLFLWPVSLFHRDLDVWTFLFHVAALRDLPFEKVLYSILQPVGRSDARVI